MKRHMFRISVWISKCHVNYGMSSLFYGLKDWKVTDLEFQLLYDIKSELEMGFSWEVTDDSMGNLVILVKF
jgi:hypothetical protein